MTFQIDQSQINSYEQTGYLLIRNYIDQLHINKLTDFVAHVISLECKSFINENSTKEEILNQSLIKLKKNILIQVHGYITLFLPPML